jgi:hypothetical protein
VCGARGVTACDGREPLYVGAEEFGECRRLDLAQLGELRRDVRDRAVVLAELLPCPDPPRRRSVTLPGEGVGEGLRAVGHRRHAEQLWPVPVHHARHAALRELADRGLPRGLRDEPDGRDGQVVVGVAEPGAPGLGQQPQLGGPAPAPLATSRRVAHARLTVGDQGVEVPADRGRADLEGLRDRGRGDRSPLEQQPRHTMPGAALGQLLVFHNTSVSYFRGGGKADPLGGDRSH